MNEPAPVTLEGRRIRLERLGTEQAVAQQVARRRGSAAGADDAREKAA